MLFFQDENKNGTHTKPRSLFGRLFNPEFGRDIEPIKESARSFVHVLASLFSSVRLFPENHPAFRDPRVRLTLREVLGTAYANLSFTRQGIPQIIYFAAVVGCLGLGVLFVLTFLLSLFVSPANAQIFEPPSAVDDWGTSWVNYLFLGQERDATVGTTAVVTPSPGAGCPVLTSLGSALRFYSTAVLVLAGLLLFYHLTFMIAETAHTGQAMGKADKIWAPIRLVFAIGLLVPVAASGGGGGGGCAVTGYNTGQYFVIQLARWSSGLASNAWQHFVTNLNTQTTMGCTGTDGAIATSPSCITVPNVSREFITSLVINDACARMYQYHIDKGGYTTTVGPAEGAYTTDSYVVTTLRTVDSPTAVGTHYLGVSGVGLLNLTAENAKKICGGYEITASPGGAYAEVYQAQLDVFDSFRERISRFNERFYLSYVKGSGTFGATDQADLEAELNGVETGGGIRTGGIINDFRTTLRDEVNDALNDADTAAANAMATDAAETAGSMGWLLAGAWFNTLTRLQANRVEGVQNALPKVIKPVVFSDAAGTSFVSAADKFLTPISVSTDNSELRGISGTVAQDLELYAKAINHTLDQQINPADLASLEVLPVGGGKSIWDALRGANPVDILLGLVDKAGGAFGLWNPGAGALAIVFGRTANPFQELAAFGQNYVSAGLWALAAAVGAGLVSETAGNILTTIAGFFFLIGFTMGFVVPLYPFIRFLFGSLTWMLSVCEAVALMPIFALAHVNPHGAGLSGGTAKYGYYLMTQVLLRPIMMIIGLVLGYLLFGAALLFLNEAFLIAARSTGAWSGGTAMIAKICYSVVYCAIVLILAKECFSTIGLFPQVILKWLGGGDVKEETFKTDLLAAAFATGGTQVLRQNLPVAAKTATGFVRTATGNLPPPQRVTVANMPPSGPIPPGGGGGGGGGGG